MTNALKYLPFEWRQNDRYCTPAGPSFKKAKTISFIAGGNKLSITLPNHSPSNPNVGEIDHVLEGDQLTQAFRAYNDDVMANDHWQNTTILSRRWAFRGPWMSGNKADLTFWLGIIKRSEGQEYKNTTLFHPRAFESALVDYFNASYGHKTDWEKQPLWYGPMNWNPQTHLPIFSVSCDFKKVLSSTNHENEHYLILPISDEHLLVARSSSLIHFKDKKGIPTFNTGPIEELRKNILKSLTMELSDTNQMKIEALRKSCSDFRLTENFAPIKWTASAPSSSAAERSETPLQSH